MNDLDSRLLAGFRLRQAARRRIAAGTGKARLQKP
jgi:hypothetical protein